MRMTSDRADPQLLAAVDEVLWRVWDPIGVNDAHEARDEYSGYAAGVLGLLLRGVDDGEIVRHLRTIETERMGLPASRAGRHQAVVAALRAQAARAAHGGVHRESP
jgi:hypothetical protein